MFPVDDPTIRLSHYVYGSPILDTSGPGFLAGEPPPGGTVTSDGIPVSATVRILLRGEPGHPSDGMVVREIVSETNGAWMVDNLNPDLRYDAVGRKAGYADVIVSNLRPMRSDLMEFVQNTLTSNNAGNGIDGIIEFTGGQPPYTYSLSGALPSGLTPVFDRRRLSFAGTHVGYGEWPISVTFMSSNGLSLTVTATLAIEPPGTKVLSLDLSTASQFTDSTGTTVPEIVSSVTVSTDVDPLGAARTSSGGAIRIPCLTNDSIFNPGVKDFTILFSAYITGVQPGYSSGYILSHGGGLNYSWGNIALMIYSGNQLAVTLRSSDTEGAPDIMYYQVVTSYPPNQWVNYELRRRGSLFQLLMNDVVVWSKSDPRPLHTTANLAGLGFMGAAYTDSGNVVKEGITGYMKNIKMYVSP